LMMLMSALGDGPERTTATVLVVAFLLWRRRGRWALSLALTMIAAAVLTPALKMSFHFARPSLLYSGADAFSFPSGHATSAAALYLILAWVVGRSTSGPGRLLFAGFAVLMTLLTGLSRIYLGAHWLSDVLAGLALGTALGLVGILLASGDTRRNMPGDARHGAVILAVLIAVGLVLGPKAYRKAERLYAPYLNRTVNKVVDPGHLGGAPGHRIVPPPGV
jgi:membrane-associated phospholipid phosphatase